MSVEPLIAALEDDGAGILEAAAYALGTLRDQRAVKPLTAVLRDESGTEPWAVRYALNGLARDGPRPKGSRSS